MTPNGGRGQGRERGCYSQGEDEALANAREAYLITIEDMRERGDLIPRATRNRPPRRPNRHPRTVRREPIAGADRDTRFS